MKGEIGDREAIRRDRARKHATSDPLS
jgi:hypothetical protein